MLHTRWLDWLAAGCLALVTAALLLWPRGVNPEELEMTLQVQEIDQPGWHQQHVEVIVRWRWLKPPRPEPFGHPYDRLVIGYDYSRWILSEPSRWYGADYEQRILSRLGLLNVDRMVQVTPGQDGEFRMVVMAKSLGEHYRAEALPIEVHYVRGLGWRYGKRQDGSGWFRFVPAGREWVKTVGGILPLH